MMMEQLEYTLNIAEISTTHSGVNELLKFYKYANQFKYKSISLNLSFVNNFDANLSCLLLSLINKLKSENKLSFFVNIPKHMNVLFRNGLVSHLKGNGNENEYPDDRLSTIPLVMFEVGDDSSFIEYLNRDFLGHRGLDSLSKTTKTNLRTHFLEIFNNVYLHANCSYPIHTCGQYFPESKTLKFSLVDLGDGFLKKIFENTNGKVSTDTESLVWSITGYNTTKDVKTFGPGGTGLKDLKTYCENNQGSFQICSGSGFLYVSTKGVYNTFNLNNHLRGSLVNIIFRNL